MGHHHAYHNSHFVEFLCILKEILKKHTSIHLDTVNAVTTVWLHLRNAKPRRPALLRGHNLGKGVAVGCLYLSSLYYYHHLESIEDIFTSIFGNSSNGKSPWRKHLQFTPQGNQTTVWNYKNIKIFSFPLPRTAVSKCLLHWDHLKIATPASSSHFLLAEQRILSAFLGFFFLNLTCIRVENN